jgi:hypothetical protein
VSYTEMTVKALRALLVERDCEAPLKAKKAELVRLLESLDDSQPEVVEAALEELPPEKPAAKALWTEVDDACSEFVSQLSMESGMSEQDIVRGMLYCSLNTMRMNGPPRSLAWINGALGDVNHVRRWIR